MQNRKKWSYYVNSQCAKNLEEFNQKLASNDFSIPGFRDSILKPVLSLAFVTSQSEFGKTINLRVNCYLNDNNEKSFLIFSSLSSDNMDAFEHFKKNLNEPWVDITYKKISDNHFFTYVQTKELYVKEEIEYFFEKINTYYQLPSDLYQEFRLAAGLTPVVLSSKQLTKFQKKHKNSSEKPTHAQGELCNLIFTDSHFDSTVWKIIKKISPKLKLFGYNCFLNEAPETTTLNDFIENQKMYIQQRIDTNIIILKLKADLGKLPKEYFYNHEENILAARAYFAKSAAIECLQNFAKLGLEYSGIDSKEVLDTSAYDHMTSAEGVAQRDRKMASAYLVSPHPVFGLIGFEHALGMQVEILSRLSLHEAQKKFCFIHVYSELPINEQEIDLRTGKIKYPLGLTLINAKEMSEEKVIELILGASRSENKQLNSMSSNFSIFHNQETCIVPSLASDWELINPDTTNYEELGPAGPGYGF